MTTAGKIDLAHLARELSLPVDTVQRTLELLDDGNTIPFITRFRKDQTGGLNEEQVQRIQKEAAKERLLAERKQTILRSIESQGKLTPELAASIQSARTLKWLEDVYFPFKPRKQTLATLARERGLEPLARQILAADPEAADLAGRAAALVKPEKGLNAPADILQAVRHILAEQFSERPDVRGRLRKIMRRTGVLTSIRIEAPEKTEPLKEPHGGGALAARVRGNEAASPQVAPPSAPPEGALAEPQPSDAVASPADASAWGGGHGEAAAQQAAAETEGHETPVSQVAAADVHSVEPAEPRPAESPVTTTVAALDGESQGAGEAAGVHRTSEPAGSPASSPKRAASDKRQLRRRAAKERKRKLFEHAFKDYYDFRESLSRLPPHRILAVNRGERAKVLRVRIDCNMDELLREAMRLIVPDGHPHAEFLAECVRDALQRLIVPSLERELRRELTEEAEEHAVKVFAGNLRKLLLQPPVRGRRIVAIDPAFRSGCKLVALDEFGTVLEHASLHVIGSEEQRARSRSVLADVIRRQRIGLVAIGNGAACRETEQLVSDVIANELQDADRTEPPIAYVIVNEAGASVYSTSQIGREELPDCDAVMRSAVSIGRRVLDPLSELVKINPANIGVGMYQHDVKAKHLRDSLDAVVNSCVNFVGVDVNTASPSLLSYVSGLNQLTARRLYDYRREHGPFRNREQIKSVPGIGEATFVQAAGFLKIMIGDNPLDATAIHPESYAGAYRVLEKLNIPLGELSGSYGSVSSATTVVASNATAAAELPPSPPAESPAGPGAGDQISTSTLVSELCCSETADNALSRVTATGSTAMQETMSAGVATTPVAATDLARPELVGAGLVNAELAATELATPELATTELATTELATAELATAELATAELANAELANAELASSALATAELTPASSTLAAEALGARPGLAERLANVNIAEISQETGIGELTLRDILAALSRPGRDPRDDFSPPPFRTGIMKLDDLKPAMELQGTVLNVVDFGAFVDIGISDSALIHISKLADRFIRDPQEVVGVGDVLKVWVLHVDRERRRVSLTAIDPHAPPRPRVQHERRPRPAKPPAPATAAAVTHSPPAQVPRQRPPRPPAPAKPGGRGRPAGPGKPKAVPPKRPPKPVRPITSAMLAGKQPMRSFSDLLQYYEKKSQDTDAAGGV